MLYFIHKSNWMDAWSLQLNVLSLSNLLMGECSSSLLYLFSLQFQSFKSQSNLIPDNIMAVIRYITITTQSFIWFEIWYGTTLVNYFRFKAFNFINKINSLSLFIINVINTIHFLLIKIFLVFIIIIIIIIMNTHLDHS